LVEAILIGSKINYISTHRALKITKTVAKAFE